MKLLLTSTGVTNKTIADSLISLVGKSVEDIRVGFINTAANVEPGDKNWYTQQLTNLQKFGFSWIDIIDISAPGVDWKQRLESVDVVMVGGGNTFHLLDQTRKSGFDIWLKENIEEKVYVGVSAGTILVTPTIAVATIEPADENLCDLTNLTALNLVSFEVSPHVPEHISHEANKKYKEKVPTDLYGIDDNSALQVMGGEVTPVSEGEWVMY